MSARLRRFLSCARGAGAVEFALVAPVLFVLLIGGLQLGWALHCGATVRYALESAARTLLIDPDATAAQVKAAMAPRLAGVVDPDEVAVTLTPDASNPASPMTRLTSVYTHDLSILFLPSWRLRFQARAAVPTP